MPEDNRLQMVIQELVRRSNDEGRRLRSLEQRVQALESKTNSVEDMFLTKIKKIENRFSTVESNIRRVSDDITKLINNFDRINKQINKFARKTDVKELERMFDLLSPIRQEFVTKEELEKELEAKS